MRVVVVVVGHSIYILYTVILSQLVSSPLCPELRAFLWVFPLRALLNASIFGLGTPLVGFNL